MPKNEVHHKARQEAWPLIVCLGADFAGILMTRGLIAEAMVAFSSVVFWYQVCEYVDPDLDHIAITGAEGRAINALPFPLDWIGYRWVAHWLDYVWIMKRFGSHRSNASHSVIPGTPIRFFHTLTFPFSNWVTATPTLWMIDRSRAYFEFKTFDDLSWAIIFLGCGLIVMAISDKIHLILDKGEPD